MSRLKILVVDDSPTTREYFTSMLKSLGHQSQTVASGAEALRSLRESDFDVVLCDLVMPEMDGLALLKQMRKEGMELPFLIITSYGSLSTAVEAVRCGADDYILRPGGCWAFGPPPGGGAGAQPRRPRQEQAP